MHFGRAYLGGLFTKISSLLSRTTEPEWPSVPAILALGGENPTHQRLADVTGTTRRTVVNVVTRLGASGMLRKGRPVRLSPGLGLAVGLALGGESLRGVLV